jgi:hypothetical protein
MQFNGGIVYEWLFGIIRLFVGELFIKFDECVSSPFLVRFKSRMFKFIFKIYKVLFTTNDVEIGVPGAIFQHHRCFAI